MKEDNRTLNQQAQHQLRKQIIRLKSAGRSNTEIVEITGLSRQCVYLTLRRFKEGGLEAIKPKAKGRRLGQKRRLHPEQENELKRLMVNKTPEQLSFKFALWTRAAVKAVVAKKFNIDLPLRTISWYLSRWGFTAQKPIKRAYEQNPIAISSWLNSTYPKIKERAAKENAEIQWGDETGLEADCYAAKGFAPAGQTPVVYLSGSPSRTRINMVSSITNQGKVRFMFYENSFNSQIFIKFLKRLILDGPRKVFLIVDNLKVHHSHLVKEWLSREEVSQKIELFYLPSYAPELNPDERLNSDLKYQVQSGLVCRTKSQVKNKALSSMRMIQKSTERVKKYFEDDKIAYAA